MQQFVAREDYTKEHQQWIHKMDLSDFAQRLDQRPARRKRKAV